MDLLKVINKDLLNLNLKANTKEDVIFALCEGLEKNGRVSNAKEFYEVVLEREKIGETGIGNNLAIPHGESDVVNTASVAVAIVEEPVEWESLDDTPAKLVFLIASPKNNKDISHLTMLSQLASTLAYEEVVRSLISIQDKDEFMEKFSGYVKKHLENR